jgi:hypothetical protein
MATQVALAIKIQSEGGEKVLKNLQDLETELGRLQTDLKTLDFGTQEFDVAVKNINRLKSSIKDVDKATEGLEAAQRVQAIGEAISIVVGGFQLLSGIIGIFISDSEDLEAVQRAEAKAVSILNAAVGIQTIVFQAAELKAKGYTLASVAATIATKAQSAATKVATAVQVAFNAALAANPIGLVIAGIVALGAAIFGVVKIYENYFSASAKLEKQLETENKVEQDLIKTKIESARQLEDQLKILTDNLQTRALENKTIEDLKKAYAGFNVFIDKNNKLTKEGIEFLKLQIQLKQDEAALVVISQKRAEKQIEFETKAAQNRATYGASAKILNKELRQEYNADFTAFDNLEKKYQITLNKTSETLVPYNSKLAERAELEKDTAKAITTTTKEQSKASIELTKNNKLLEARIKLFDDLVSQISATQSTELAFTDDVLEKQNEIIERQNTLLSLRRSELEKDEGVFKDLINLFFETIPNEADLKESTDAVFDFFNFINIQVAKGDIDISKKLGFEELLQLFKQGTGASEELLAQIREIPDETKASFNEFFNSYVDRIDAINKVLDDNKKIETALFDGELKNREELLKLIIDIEKQQSAAFTTRIEQGKTEADILEEGRAAVAVNLGITTKIVDIEKERIQIAFNINQEKRKGKDADTALIASLEQEDALLVKNLESYNTLIDTILDGVVRNNKFNESIAKGQKGFEKQNATIQKNKKLIDATFNPEQLTKYFAGLGDALDVVLPSLVIDLQSYLERFGVEGTEAIIKGVVQGLKEQGKLTRQEAQKTIDILKKAAVALKTAFGFNIDPFSDQIKLLEKLLGKLPKAVSPLAEKFTEIQDITRVYFQVLDDLSNRLSSTIAQNNANLFDQINYQEQLSLSRIGEANSQSKRENDRILAERAETEQKFAKQRFDLEKKSRIQELNFALANAISGGAQAIINALALPAPPPIPQIYAASLGVLTGAQVQVIQNQLTTAQNKTFIARRGGLVDGSTSHEQGGVPALLEGGEFVMNREAVSKFGGIIGDINSSTGGRKLAIDDSRIVQAIASQNANTTPLKAYVLYNSIQDTEKLNKKITKLARL